MNKLKTSVRVNELDGLSDAIVRFYKADENAKADAFLSSQMEKLEELSAKITEAVLRDRLVSDLRTKDKERSRLVSDFGNLVRGYKSIPDTLKRRAAEYLDTVYSKYSKSKIYSANYKAKSSLIESLLGDLACENAIEHIGRLDGAESLVASIRIAQDSFASASDAYTKASAVKPESASSFKKSMLFIINSVLVPYFTMLGEAGNSTHETLAEGIESEISRVNMMIRARAAANKPETA